MKILAVDDDKTILELLGLAIQVFGNHDVVCAGSAPDALQRIAEADTPFDCFLLDIQMPKVTGIDLCGAIRANDTYTDTPIIMLTAMSEKRYIDAAFSTGASDFIIKPFDMMDLKNRLIRVESMAFPRAEESETAPTLNSLANSLSNKNTYNIDEVMPMQDIDQVLHPDIFANYLDQLHRLQYLRTRIFAVQLHDIEKIYGKSRGAEFHDHITDIAEVIQDHLCDSEGLLSYFGQGIFCCVIDGKYVEMLEDMPVELDAAIYNLNMCYRDGSPVDVRLEIGGAVTPRIFTKLSASNIIHKAVANLGGGQISLPAIKFAS
jgi:CheY-like chemotaxis protein